MNQNIKFLFFLIKESKVLACESNLKEFLSEIEKFGYSRNYDAIYRRFKKNTYFDEKIGDEVYFFQKMEFYLQ